MTAEEMIKNYDKYKEELSILDFRIKNFKGISENDIIESMLFEYHESEGSHTNAISDKTAKVALNFRKEMDKINSDMLKYYLERYYELKRELDFFDFAIKKIENSAIMIELFLCNSAWIDVENKFAISHSLLGKYRKKAIKDLDAIYKVREKYETEYMLT